MHRAGVREEMGVAVQHQRLFNTKGVTQDRLARLFKVDVPTIRQVIRQRGDCPMNDVVDVRGLSDSQKRLVKVIQRHTQRLVAAELAELELPIREMMADIQTRVETELQTYTQRLDKAIAKEEAT